MSYVDLMIQRSIQALDAEGGQTHDWSDLSTYDFNDPVSLVTEPEASPNYDADEGMPRGFEDARDFVDKMTSTPREAKQGRETFAQSTPGSSAAFQAAQAATGLEQLTTGDFVRKALAKKGMDYVWGGESKAEGGWDCSGLIVDIMRKNGFASFPRMVSGTLIEHAKPMSVAKAIKTRGALLWAEGHIAISLGNGKTIEAANTQDDIKVGIATGRFTKGGMLPELVVGGSKGKTGKRTRNRSVARTRQESADPLNRLNSVSSLNAAPMVFGSIWGEVQERPVGKVGWERAAKNPSLHFVPAKYRNLFLKAAEQYGLPARLLATVAQHESSFDPNAVSSAGAQGLMQIMPLHGLDKPFNPKQNVMAGARILASYIEGMGSLRLGLAAYNAGMNNHEAGLGYADMVLATFRGEG